MPKISAQPVATSPDAIDLVGVQAGVTKKLASTLLATQAELDAHLHTGTYVDLVAAPTGVAATDTAALNNALAASGGKTVRTQPGTYVHSGLTMGVAGTRLLLDPGTTLQLANTANVHSVTATAIDCTVEGGTINGNKANQTLLGAGVYSEVSGLTVRDTKFVNTRWCGVWTKGASRVTVERVSVTDSGYIGIFCEPNGAAITDVVVRDCLVDRSALAAATIVEGGIKIRGASGFLLSSSSVTGCRALMPVSPTDPTAIAIETQYAPFVHVSDNYTAGGEMGISVAVCDNAVTSGNTVNNADTFSIEITGSRYSTTLGNTIDGASNATVGIILAVAVNNSDFSTVSGNVIINCDSCIQTNEADFLTISGNVGRGGTGLMLNIINSDGSAISGNTLNGLSTATKGVMLDSCKACVVVGNSIRNVTETGVMLYSATAAFSITENTVAGNTFSNTNVPVGTQVSGGASVSEFNQALANVGVNKLDIVNDVNFLTGAGSPEGAKSASPGSVYLRRDSGGTVLYVKESGTGTTGWVAGLTDGATSVATSPTGFAEVLPLLPLGYLRVRIGGVLRKVPYYEDFQRVVVDDFSDANGTAMNGKASDTAGVSWTCAAGVVEVQSGACSGGTTAGTGPHLLTTISDALIVTRMVAAGTDAGANAGVIARWTDDDNFLLATFDRATNQAHIYRKTAGAFVAMSSAAYTYPAAGTVLDVRFKVVGTALTMIVNGVTVASTTHAQGQSALRHGLYMASGNLATFNDFEVFSV